MVQHLIVGKAATIDEIYMLEITEITSNPEPGDVSFVDGEYWLWTTNHNNQRMRGWNVTERVDAMARAELEKSVIDTQESFLAGRVL
jgi:hypothetical protein